LFRDQGTGFIIVKSSLIPVKYLGESRVSNTGTGSGPIVLVNGTVKWNIPYSAYLVKAGDEEPELAGLEAWSSGIAATSSPVPKINKLGNFTLSGIVCSLLL